MPGSCGNVIPRVEEMTGDHGNQGLILEWGCCSFKPISERI